MILFGNPFFFQGKNGEEYEDSHNGHHQAPDSTCRQREPERFLARTHHERDKAQNGRYHRQEDGDNLGIPCLDESTDRYQLGITTTHGIILVHDVDAGIDRNPAQQHKRGKATLVEIQSEQIEREKDTDV